MDTQQEITVWGLPPIWGAPSPSPFVIKLMTWLRMANVPYQTRALKGPMKSKTGKIPYITLSDGRLIADSEVIIAHLTQERGIDLDSGLSPLERASGHALRRMLEEHLYFVGLWERWLSTNGWPSTARDYFAFLP